MKLPKTLLQSIALGLALGGALSSCEIIDGIKDIKPTSSCDETCEQSCDEDHQGKGDVFSCPACGMG